MSTKAVMVAVPGWSRRRDFVFTCPHPLIGVDSYGKVCRISSLCPLWTCVLSHEWAVSSPQRVQEQWVRWGLHSEQAGSEVSSVALMI